MKRMLLFIGLFFLTTKLCYATSIQESHTTSEVIAYIEKSWDTLTRNGKNSYWCDYDEKLPGKKAIIYLPRIESQKLLTKTYRQALKKAKNGVEFRYLPKDISRIKEHGLLYLPYSYVVPGGRFNEMYGWDSYFIELGLLKQQRFDLVRHMIDNFIYEITYYGAILNANRTYYLQRSQPPFLSEMILDYYQHVQDKAWLQTTLPALIKLHQYWTSEPHLVKEIGLSRYYAGGAGATPEESKEYYQKVKQFFSHYAGNEIKIEEFYDKKHQRLTDKFYIADRTVRESGFDISAKYGPFSVGILDFIPVDLNVLLYQLEKDIAQIYAILNIPAEQQAWFARATKRAGLINKYLWSEEFGYYFDYNFRDKSLRPYIYATTFYPLWAGVATVQQAEKIKNNLGVLLEPGGLATSIYHPGLQWDAPFGWAPLQYIAVKGLARYGYYDQSLDIAKRFIRTVNKGYQQAHTIFEKYDVEHNSIQSEDKIKYSYATNEVGFGWTNGVYLALVEHLRSNSTIEHT